MPSCCRSRRPRDSWVEARPFVEQVGDLVDDAQDRLAADLGRVGGDHRAHAQVADDVPDQIRRDAGRDDAIEARGEAAGPRRVPATRW